MLSDGDIVNIDITAFIGGVHGDTDATYLVGDVDEESRLLVERTETAMMRGIKAVAPGRPVSVIGRVIEAYAKTVRLRRRPRLHRTRHRDVVSLRAGDPPLRRAGVRHLIESGMTFTIEPMLTLGTIDYEIWDDGWTVVTADRKRTAQFEHTLLVTDSGAEILTLP